MLSAFPCLTYLATILGTLQEQKGQPMLATPNSRTATYQIFGD